MKRIVIANSNNCRIFDYEKPGNLTLIKEINCPENKLKNSELGCDRPGRYNGDISCGGSYSQAMDMKEVHIDKFARTLAVELERERNKHDYEQLVVIMPAQMDGLFCHHLNKNVKALITRTLRKNIVNLNGHALLAYLDAYA